jgi:hypothetical protein
MRAAATSMPISSIKLAGDIACLTFQDCHARAKLDDDFSNLHPLVTFVMTKTGDRLLLCEFSPVVKGYAVPVVVINSMMFSRGSAVHLVRGKAGGIAGCGSMKCLVPAMQRSVPETVAAAKRASCTASSQVPKSP